MDIFKQNLLTQVAGGQDRGTSLFVDSHGQVDIGITIADNQPLGQITAESSLCQHAHIRTELSMNAEGNFNGYVGMHASW